MADVFIDAVVCMNYIIGCVASIATETHCLDESPVGTLGLSIFSCNYVLLWCGVHKITCRL